MPEAENYINKRGLFTHSLKDESLRLSYHIWQPLIRIMSLNCYIAKSIMAKEEGRDQGGVRLAPL
jgi:hypothetical protein